MTRPGLTYLQLIVDRSGSMLSIKGDMEGALNQFIEDQKKVPGECRVSFAQFDDVYETVFVDRDINDCPKIEIMPRNMTALHDAIGRTTNLLGDRLSRMNEEQRPEHVLVVVVSDGYENASKEFKADRVREMIRHQEDVYKWAYTFIGANQDAALTGAQLGYARGSTVSFSPNAHSVALAASSLSNATTRIRSGAADSYVYDSKESDVR